MLGAIERKRFVQRGLIIVAATDVHFGTVFGRGRAVTSSWSYFGELFILVGVVVYDFSGYFYPFIRTRIETVHVRIAQDVPCGTTKDEEESTAFYRDV